MESEQTAAEQTEFEEWFGEHGRWLMRLATVLAGPDVGEDIVQDVVIKLQRRWETIRHLDQPRAYVRRMVVNEHLSFRRRWGRVIPRDALQDGPSRATDHAEQHADRALLTEQIRRLPPKQRAVVALRFFEGLDDAAIAAALGCSPGTVRSHASRALAALRIQLTSAQNGYSQETSHAH